ncbi:hypothetical protein OJ997_24775 [Solirubrobacter phytolaccae]|uniref:Uncharacterized protein n=1 Tax=Solirubrobacter phytolaccae TaxID=1404360 RepID=A0A9X3NEL6_9ACTN|nr:hypothetical protein [Solirubrobacter phytolaccae]MDA0183547.1 hypothetical protein [Solirubrobacter phytolaccae]
MSVFDAELHLRLVAERALLEAPDPRHGGGEETVATAAARALVAIGALAAETAGEVLEEYTFAATLRGHEVHELFHHLHAPPRTAGPAALEPLRARRVAAIGQDVAHAAGTLRLTYVIFGERAELGVVGLLDESAFNHGPPSLRVKDDTGTEVQAEFAGGWSGRQLHGTFYPMRRTLSPTTRWLEVEGQRLELRDEDAHHEVRLEPLRESDPALRHLWRQITPDEWSHRPAPLETVIDTLVASGALVVDHPELDTIRRVHTALDGNGGGKRGLPEPWRSLRRGHGHPRGGDGPRGVVVVGAVTPVFDECAVAVDVLESSEDGWSLIVRVTPSAAVKSHFGGDPLRSHLVWWAADDRRHTYVAHTGNWDGSETEGSGVIQFEAPLDAKASYVDLMPTGHTHRAVIRVPLVWR